MGFIKTYKLWFILALAIVLATAWFSDRTLQYRKGKEECELAQAKAQADYWEDKTKELAASAKEALKTERRTSSRIDLLTNRKKEEVKRELEKPIADSCLFSDDELRELEAIVRETN